MGFRPLEWCRDERRGLLFGPAKWLWKKQEKYRIRHPQPGLYGGAQEALRTICGETQAKKYYERYQIQKNRRLLLLFLVGMGMSAAFSIAFAVQRRVPVRVLERPEPSEGVRQYDLQVLADGDRAGKIVVEVPVRQLTPQEAEEFLRQAEEELDTIVGNWYPDAVDDDLSFPDRLQDGVVDVRFDSSRYDVLDGAGHVRNAWLQEEGEVVDLRAVLTCGESRRECVYPIRVIPKGSEFEARLEREAMRRIQGTDAQKTDKTVVLPQDFDGKSLRWETKRSFYGGWTAFLTAVGCLTLYVAFEKDLAKEGEKYREELLLVYPSFLAKLTLLAGTGMPVRMVFFKMAQEAKRKDAAPVYEEVLRTCREMESGETELQAYENFGVRCRLPQYKKCASLLSQNVQKGTGRLLDALRQESVNAFEERKAFALRKGEEAQTKMILPMLMMLVAVMILVMVPACFSFGGLT